MGAAERDLQERRLREQQVEARRLLEAIGAALAADADLLDPGERADIDLRVATLARLAEGADADAIRRASEDLTHATDEFAARRMDRSIRAALSGRRVDELAR
jgi:molecular chaperone HscA